MAKESLPENVRVVKRNGKARLRPKDKTAVERIAALEDHIVTLARRCRTLETWVNEFVGKYRSNLESIHGALNTYDGHIFVLCRIATEAREDDLLEVYFERYNTIVQRSGRGWHKAVAAWTKGATDEEAIAIGEAEAAEAEEAAKAEQEATAKDSEDVLLAPPEVQGDAPDPAQQYRDAGYENVRTFGGS